MGRLVVQEWMTLDGVVQAPGAANEDRSGGFAHGGWHLRYFDDRSQKWVIDNLNRANAFLFGRRTYESFAGHWPNASEEEQVLARPLNTKRKLVVSTTLDEPLEWENAELLRGAFPASVASLKASEEGDLLVIGSAELVRSLAEHELVDEYRLMIDPVMVGGGKRVLPDDGSLRRLSLADSEVTTTGAILATYVLAGVEA